MRLAVLAGLVLQCASLAFGLATEIHQHRLEELWDIGGTLSERCSRPRFVGA